MGKLQTEVLVIGGGATGTGVVRDLAMRGFKTILLEKGDLSQGTTGRYHGLLHSGGRYVVRDPQAARECIEENRILRKIMPACIEDTGGYFVLTPFDDPEYAPKFVQGCHDAGIPVEEIQISQMLSEEPYLNPEITRCFRVPDASADSFLASELNIKSAISYGAVILNYHKVTGFLRSNQKIVGITCHNLAEDEILEIDADVVVNASGAWAGRIAALAGLEVSVIPGKGTMAAVNHRIVNTVINRCKFPSDGDILVPAHTVAVIGTTDIKVEDPDHFSIEPWEIDLMLGEGEKIVPGFKDFRILRAWAGVRPLYQDTSTVNDTRDVTRSFILLDHEQRDALEGLITITGGKWTTYRKMAEVTVDLVCRKLEVQRECRTHLEPLPDLRQVSPSKHHAVAKHFLGTRLAEIETNKAYGKLVCECELVTEDEVIHSILQGKPKTIDDIRREVRVGMGPCQGGFCTYRVAGLLHKIKKPPVDQTNLAIRDFLQERWKGLLPILWGQQLRQERLDELIYLSILNADHLPGPRTGRLSPELYTPPETKVGYEETAAPVFKEFDEVIPSIFKRFGASSNQAKTRVDLIVIGAGLAGLFAAYLAAKRGKKVKLVSKGWGALYWQPGCIDLLGYDPEDGETLILSPAETLSNQVSLNPAHPYARAGFQEIQEALEAIKDLTASYNYPLHGTLERNWLLPTAIGALRPTCLAPETMIAGDMSRPDPVLVVGFEGFLDFYPEMIADNLLVQGISSRGIRIELAELQSRNFTNSRNLASLFEQPRFRESVIREISRQLSVETGFTPARIGFPAVLGLRQALEVKKELESGLGYPIFEIPTLPPSIPGIRLSQILCMEIERLGGQVLNGLQANRIDTDGDRMSAVWTSAASRNLSHRAEDFILATGGLLGGGIIANYDGKVEETVCGLPVSHPGRRDQWLHSQFLTKKSHPIFLAGIECDDWFRPIGNNGLPLYRNLYAVGNSLSGFDAIQERSHEGVALVSSFMVGQKYL